MLTDFFAGSALPDFDKCRFSVKEETWARDSGTIAPLTGSPSTLKTKLEPQANEILLDFDAVAEVESFFDEVKEKSGFYLQLDRELKQYERLAMTAVAPPELVFEFEAEVIQVFPVSGAFGTAFQLCWRPGQSKDLADALAGKASTEEHPNVVSPAHKIREMNPNERFMLATKASRPERQILLRDKSPQVLLGLLAHPRLEDKELLEVLKSPHSTGAIMERVAGNRKWMSIPGVSVAIVKSPKTATPLAIKLLDNLHVNDLRVMAKSSAVREPVRKAALRVYLTRSGQRS